MSDKTPAHLFENLCFDELPMDTALAEEYLKNLNMESKLEGSKYYIIDIGSFCIGQNYHEAYKAVAQKIRDNAMLFAQLEYLVRKFKPEDVLKYDVPMIAQNFDRLSIHKSSRSCSSPLVINFTTEVPLAILGFAAEAIKCTFLVTKETVAVAMLFGKLCKESGLTFDKEPIQESNPDLNYDSLYYYVNIRIASLDGSMTHDTTAGSVAVVTGKSDVDSALENVLHATRDHRYPWYIKRVIVQESVYDHFRTCLSNKDSDSFIFDFAGTEHQTPLILVEAYRTTKELLSLLKKYNPLYLSLWCNDVSTSNEIAIKTSASTVWINDFGVISTSTSVTPSFFTGYDIFRSGLLKLNKNILTWRDPAVQTSKDIDKLLKLRVKWAAKSSAQRKVAVLDVIDRIEEHDALYWHGIRDAIMAWEPKTFFEVHGGRISFGFQMAYGAYFQRMGLEDVVNNMKSLILGNAIIFQFNSDNRDSFPLTEFEKSGIPFVYSQLALVLESAEIEEISEVVKVLPNNHPFVNLFKIISSGFGETC